MGKKTIDALVEGGSASAGPPLGPALGPLGVNTGQIIAKINEVTSQYKGMKVPVKVIVDTNTKEFEVEVGPPPTGELIKKELGISAGRKEKEEVVGDLQLEKAIEIAKKKEGGSLARGIKNLTKEVLGTCVSMGVACNGKGPKEIIKEIDEGKHDSLFAGG